MSSRSFAPSRRPVPPAADALVSCSAGPPRPWRSSRASEGRSEGELGAKARCDVHCSRQKSAARLRWARDPGGVTGPRSAQRSNHRESRSMGRTSTSARFPSADEKRNEVVGQTRCRRACVTVGSPRSSPWRRHGPALRVRFERQVSPPSRSEAAPTSPGPQIERTERAPR